MPARSNRADCIQSPGVHRRGRSNIFCCVVLFAESIAVFALCGEESVAFEVKDEGALEVHTNTPQATRQWQETCDDSKMTGPVSPAQEIAMMAAPHQLELPCPVTNRVHAEIKVGRAVVEERQHQRVLIANVVIVRVEQLVIGLKAPTKQKPASERHTRQLSAALFKFPRENTPARSDTWGATVWCCCVVCSEPAAPPGPRGSSGLHAGTMGWNTSQVMI